MRQITPPHLADASADLDVVVPEQLQAEGQIVDALGNEHRRKLRHADVVGRQESETEGPEAGAEGEAVAPMPGVALVHTLIEDGAQGLVKGVDHGDGSGVVIASGRSLPVAPEQAEVEVPGGGRHGAACDGVASVVAQEDGGEAGRRAQALLRGTEGEVDPCLLDGNLHAAERGDGIHQE